ncbi:uncharacterized protein QC763_001010 [Podospora pseudopauciseta]|uniref:TAFII28-like protein domain-containing protein n=2 Tax=Podospora TaxID=5144 RepID=A0ABR0HK74_9PEZI|nr:hypothetical protein QC763_001010 [Podospora pseudopauciseta]KAK4678928.1 hypothetical protein QC764_001010 [Podospora pseudoanserina]
MNSTPNKKRTADGASVQSPALKRRKASTMSISSIPGSAHPLRQTSFPPPDDLAGARSPSVDFDAMSHVSGSQVSMSVTGPPKKKRGRKSKADKARERTPSVVGGTAKSTAGPGGSVVSGAGGKSTAPGAAGGAGEDGDGDEDGDTEVAATGAALTKEQKEEEHRQRGMLIGAFNDEQFDRFENWRAANLSKAAVRRLVNATISQSVAENVVIGMRAVAKVFIGDIIESARRVQGEWIDKTGEKQTDLPTPPATAVPSPAATGEGSGVPHSGQLGLADNTASNTAAPVEGRRGPLRPEHIREAMRRYKTGLEGGGVGMQQIWHQQQQSGVERFPTRTGGRKIFR